MAQDFIYTALGFTLLVAGGITIIGFIAYLGGVSVERIQPVLTVTIPITIFCTVIGLWKRRVFEAMIGFLLPF